MSIEIRLLMETATPRRNPGYATD